MEKKQQHWIPESYLKAWIDLRSPYKPGYVWKYSKDGKYCINKSPKNIFVESDFYTHYVSDGTRDVSLEDKLSDIETNFGRVRNKLKLKQILSEVHVAWM